MFVNEVSSRVVPQNSAVFEPPRQGKTVLLMALESSDQQAGEDRRLSPLQPNSSGNSNTAPAGLAARSLQKRAKTSPTDQKARQQTTSAAIFHSPCRGPARAKDGIAAFVDPGAAVGEAAPERERAAVAAAPLVVVHAPARGDGHGSPPRGVSASVSGGDFHPAK